MKTFLINLRISVTNLNDFHYCSVSEHIHFVMTTLAFLNILLAPKCFFVFFKFQDQVQNACDAEYTATAGVDTVMKTQKTTQAQCTTNTQKHIQLVLLLNSCLVSFKGNAANVWPNSGSLFELSQSVCFWCSSCIHCFHKHRSHSLPVALTSILFDTKGTDYKTPTEPQT